MAKPISQLYRDLQRRGYFISDDAKAKIPRAAGNEIAACFRDSFTIQRFNDNGSQKWAEVERRKPNSPWFGHGTKGRSAESRPILIGTTKLQKSIRSRVKGPMTVGIYSDVEYARVHNEGLNFKIYGKTPAKMPQRQFMGYSEKAIKEGFKEIDKIINKDMLK